MTALELMARFAARENAAMLARIDRVYGRDDTPTGRPRGDQAMSRQEKERLIVNAVRANPGLTRPQYMAATGLGERRWKATITGLVRQGRIRFEKSGPRYTYFPGPKP